jgi:outer membrane biosynthesis protein TonB
MTRKAAIPFDFTAGEISVSVIFALVIQVFFFVLLVAVGVNRMEIHAREDASPRELPIAVKPMLDDAPLLKLGGKKMRPKLPEMWKKHEPVPVKRFEDKSAPSEKAEDNPDAIPTSSVALGDAEAPPPDAEVAKEVDDSLKDLDAAVAENDNEGPGAADGVKEGTETDPLKARAVSQYMMKILGWFNSRFKPPVGQIPCDELKKLSTSVTANVSSDGTVTGYSISRSSGNATFDAKVKATMGAIVGQTLPPPPPLYPEILGSTVQPTFSGRGAKCE